MADLKERFSDKVESSISDNSIPAQSAAKRKGMVHVYTGDGKGKTTAALGLALRSLGHGHNVQVIQFLKGGHYTGELIAAETLLQKSGSFKISQFGKGCLKTDRQMRLFTNGNKLENCPKNFNVRDDVSCGECRDCFLSDHEEIEQTKRAMEYAREVLQSDDVDVVVLDEISHVLSKRMVSTDDVMEMIDTKKPHIELILTGRNAPSELIDRADLVTEMREIKHPFRKGVEGRKGIEY